MKKRKTPRSEVGGISVDPVIVGRGAADMSVSLEVLSDTCWLEV